MHVCYLCSQLYGLSWTLSNAIRALLKLAEWGFERKMDPAKVWGDDMTLEGLGGGEGAGAESGSIIGMCMYIFNE